MLHILLFILKIIGIILAVILGIILLAICIILFVPVCYRAEGKCGGTLDDIRARGRVSWLFGLVKVVVNVKGKAVDYYIKIAWKKLGDRLEKAEEREDDADCEELYSDLEDWDQSEKAEDTEVTEVKEVTENAGTAEKIQKVEAPEPHAESSPSNAEKASAGSNPPNQKASEESSGDSGVFERAGKKIHGIGSGIKKSFEKIKCTFREFCDKIKEILKKKDLLTAFITDEIHLGALGKAKKEAFKLLRRMGPRVLMADIHYGFDDPCLTGQVLAVLGALYPLIGEHTQITPDFQEKILEGKLKIRGQIYVVHLAVMALNMLLCREVRQTIKDIREFKL